MIPKFFKRKFTLNDSVTYLCPTCNDFTLQLQPQKFHSEDTSGTKKMQASDDYYEPEYFSCVFSAVFICKNSKCKESVVCLGDGYVDFDEGVDSYGDYIRSYFDVYVPKVFMPTIHFFNIPENCPETVKIPLIEAFSITLLSPSSSANKVRVSIENLLTSFKIPKTTVNKKKKRVRLNLDARIEKAKGKHTVLGQLEDILHAIKWLGNAGSHSSSEIILDDVFDAYDLMEHILLELFQPKHELNKLAKAIRKRKGPIKK
ncbi:DUF4145 domain-containing protein [Acinetobacter pittii]|nr:DUF4145 domain-containing protein [Acinetobacter pittii]